MSKMRKCRACGEDVAKTASNCPKCGAATWDSVILHAVQFAAVLIGGAYLYYVIFG
jgi:predicted ATP-dependent serine protease